MNKQFIEHDLFAIFDLILYTGVESFYAHEDMIKKAKKGSTSQGSNRIYGFLADEYNVSESNSSTRTSSCL